MPKKRHNTAYYFLFSLTFLFMITGCAGNRDNQKEGMALIQRTDPPAMDIRSVTYQKDGVPEKVKSEVVRIDGIYDVVAVQNGKDILVAYKVNHMHRFQMKKIEKNVNDRLKKKFKGYKFTVSSDYKIFLETVRLNNMLREKDVPEKKAKEKFQKIVKLQKELT
ncbi:YhcN/YlaJ family sporulation lipoprotein [Bacillus sp. V59.32b]|uniref:YhcN/YlaJ family sporulation lipoprotein n=1 Tax=Bacillus sp. V59.32b TaxID=1758642 RepID=UPI000E3C7B94|nr:YhcN/YlaJ family sporulation lipoprotein [Bacillus sp. V59.32b]RFU63069.1 sporulation protein [Bacillus sp. V59.32b]